MNPDQDGIAPSEQPLTGDEAAAEKKAKPPYAADDGKSGGRSQGGRIGGGTFSDVSGDGNNAQSGGPAGSETEAEAPGAATYKKSDDLK